MKLIENNLVITNTFHDEIIENKAKLADNMKVLLYEEDNLLFNKLDFDNDDIFLEPLLFNYFNTNPKDRKYSLEQILLGYFKKKDIEAKIYFEQKWQPPGELKQSLEYRLLLNADGSIKRVVSLGKGSQLYLDQTNIPVNGELFISPLSESQSSTIRLLLNPDGRVQAFTE